MSLWFDVHVNLDKIGSFEARRHEPLDLADPAQIADEVCTYTIRIDGETVGTVRHRYGDGAWALVRAGLTLAAAGQRDTPATGCTVTP